jgi:hypothetical protein
MTFPALLAHSSPPLRSWRFAGVVFLLAQAVSDSLTLRDTWKAKHVVDTCLANPSLVFVEGVACRSCTTKAWQAKAVGHPERLWNEPLHARAEQIDYVVWWYLLLDIFVHFISGRKVGKGKDLKPLYRSYLNSYWFHVDVGCLMPGLMNAVLTFVLTKSGLNHPLHFAVTHIKIRLRPPQKLIKPGKIIRQLLVSLVRFSMHHRRLVRSLIAEIEIIARVAETGRLIANEGHVLAELVEQAEDAYYARGSLRAEPTRVSPRLAEWKKRR